MSLYTKRTDEAHIIVEIPITFLKIYFKPFSTEFSAYKVGNSNKNNMNIHAIYSAHLFNYTLRNDLYFTTSFLRLSFRQHALALDHM